MTDRVVILVHGGAGTHSAIAHDGQKIWAYEDGVKTAARAGYSRLLAGGSAVEAVEAAVTVMEDRPEFNAGKGSHLTVDGSVEMDAAIMDGQTLSAGAVACIRNVANPVQVARMVMEKTDHVLLVGDGACTFAEQSGFAHVPTTKLITKKALKRLEQFADFCPSVEAEFHNRDDYIEDETNNHDTVGAVALDSQGNVAFATSTGGICAKMTGRVGDSCVLGAGGYADNTVGASSTTGHGESFLKTCLAFYLNSLMVQGMKPQPAVENAIKYMERRVGGNGGIIAVNKDGETGMYFNTEGMSWAQIKNNQLHYGIYKDERKTEPV